MCQEIGLAAYLDRLAGERIPFLASSVFLKKPERIVALALFMVLCLIVYRLTEHRLRTR